MHDKNYLGDSESQSVMNGTGKWPKSCNDTNRRQSRGAEINRQRVVISGDRLRRFSWWNCLWGCNNNTWQRGRKHPPSAITVSNFTGSYLPQDVKELRESYEKMWSLRSHSVWNNNAMSFWGDLSTLKASSISALLNKSMQNKLLKFSGLRNSN
jgi:hypothetical protein